MFMEFTFYSIVRKDSMFVKILVTHVVCETEDHYGFSYTNSAKQLLCTCLTVSQAPKLFFLQASQDYGCLGVLPFTVCSTERVPIGRIVTLIIFCYLCWFKLLRS